MENNDLHGHSPILIQLVLGCSRTTAYRYNKSQPENVPVTARRLLAVLLEGDLGEVDRAWRGWRVARGQLWRPDGSAFSPGEVQCIPFRKAQVAHLQALQRLPQQADFIEGSWQEARAAESA